MDVIHLRKTLEPDNIKEPFPDNAFHNVNLYGKPMNDLLIKAIAAGRCSSAFIEHAYHNRRQKIVAMPQHDLKLDIDTLAEEKIIAILRNFYPDHSFYSEEQGLSAGSAPYIWVIDPLDGSVNYYFGIGECAVSIACYQLPDPVDDHITEQYILANGSPLIGLILLPLSQNIYTAVHGKGAYYNGIQLVIPHKTLSRSVISMNFSGRGNNMDKMPSILELLVPRVLKIRSFGVTAVDSAWVAEGRLGALIQRGAHLWDFAAGKIIIEEAGGFFSCKQNPDSGWDIITAAPSIYEEIVEHIQGAAWI